MLLNCEIYDEDKLSNVIEKEENSACIVNLQHPEFLPDQILRGKPAIVNFCKTSIANLSI